MCIHKDKLVPTYTPNGMLLNVKCTSTHPAIYPSIKAREYKKTFGEFPPMNEYFLRRIASLGEVELAEQYGIVRCPGRDPPYVQPVIYKPPDLPVVVPPSRAPPRPRPNGRASLVRNRRRSSRRGNTALLHLDII